LRRLDFALHVLRDVHSFLIVLAFAYQVSLVQMLLSMTIT
jgi:hypothetical protein